MTYNDGFDTCDGDYIVRIGEYLLSPEGVEYEIQELLGTGTFG